MKGNDKLRLERVAIATKLHAKEASSVVRTLVKWLDERGIETRLEESLAGKVEPGVAFTLDRIPRDLSLVIVLGGDGTLLSVARALGSKQIPILGVNLGNLGFLTDVALQDLYSTLEAVLEGEAIIDSRMMLRAELSRKGEVLASEIVLNDVVITKGAIARMIEVGVEIDRQFVALVRADGLIVSTPTGSTAYSLAAGGPILHPNLDAMILTPICPHTLTHRPVVVSDRAQFELTLRGDSGEVYVTFDGQSSVSMEPGDIVRVRKSRHEVKLVSLPDKNYFRVLRHKLRWAERPRSRRHTTPPKP
ncbi:MAG: NAD(+)/NADH kinase [Vicinamibacteria bacterium]